MYTLVDDPPSKVALISRLILRSCIRLTLIGEIEL